LISLASTYFYDADPAQAAVVYEQALVCGTGIPPLQQSRVHAELAVVYGQLGHERQTLRATDLASQLYPTRPEHDPSFLYAEFTHAALVLEHGLAHMALAEREPGSSHRRTAADIFARIEQTAPAAVSDRIRYEIINHQARTAVLCNDLDAFETYASLGAEGVRRLGSGQREKELRIACERAIQRWPHERRLNRLSAQLPAAPGQALRTT